MNEIRKLNLTEFESAINFANKQFGCDFRINQPKLYRNYDSGEHYACFFDGQIVAFMSAYPITTCGLKILSVGTVCVAEEFRGRGIMGSLFEFAARWIFPEYDLISLIGIRERYENFGFYKTGKKIIFTIKRPSKPTLPFEIREINDQVEIELIYSLYNKEIQREKSDFYDILRTQCSKVYRLDLPGKQSYIVYNERKNAVFEFCGEADESEALLHFMQYKNLSSIELYSSIDCDKRLFFVSDRYAVSTLCNLNVINYKRVIVSLLKKVSNKSIGTLKIAVDSKFTIAISVSSKDVDIKISETAEDFDISLSEKELYLLLFDDYFMMFGNINIEKSGLIRSWFPLPLWNTLTTLDGI